MSARISEIGISGAEIYRCDADTYLLTTNSGRITLFSASSHAFKHRELDTWRVGIAASDFRSSTSPIFVGAPGTIFLIRRNGIRIESVAKIPFDTSKPFVPQIMIVDQDIVWWATTARHVYQLKNGVVSSRPAIPSPDYQIDAAVRVPGTTQAILALSSDHRGSDSLIVFDFKASKMVTTLELYGRYRVFKAGAELILIEKNTEQVKVPDWQGTRLRLRPLGFASTHTGFLRLSGDRTLMSGIVGIELAQSSRIRTISRETILRTGVEHSSDTVLFLGASKAYKMMLEQ